MTKKEFLENKLELITQDIYAMELVVDYQTEVAEKDREAGKEEAVKVAELEVAKAKDRIVSLQAQADFIKRQLA